MADRLWSETTAPIFAALGGAVMGALALEVTPLQALSMTVAGGLSGAFVVPAAAEYFGATSVQSVSFVSFVCGMFALPFARLVNRRFDVLGNRALNSALKRVGVDVPPEGASHE